MATVLRVGIVAGESSGDILGAGLMQELRKLYPQIEFEGIGGPLMEAEGFSSMVPMERLSVMGLIEPLKRLGELLGIRAKVIKHFIASPPDVFIGIDSPDFTLNIELKLKLAGIKTVHYVSPSVWAWRQKRIGKISKATNLVLTLFPFEASFYEAQQVPVCFVGHPLADQIALVPDQQGARRALGLALDGQILAMLPGSRQGEVSRLGPVFVETAVQMLAVHPALRIVIPCANASRRDQLEAMLPVNESRLILIDGRSREVMAAADTVLLASGTAALEAMLLKKPMLVCYKMAGLSYAIISRMLKVPYFSLPNLLAGERLVEELVQDEVNAKVLKPRLEQLLNDETVRTKLFQHYQAIHLQLRLGASEKAASAVASIL